MYHQIINKMYDKKIMCNQFLVYQFITNLYNTKTKIKHHNNKKKKTKTKIQKYTKHDETKQHYTNRYLNLSVKDTSLNNVHY